MFEYIESEVDSIIDEVMISSFVCYTKSSMEALEIRNLLKGKGLQDVRVLKINSLTFLVNKCEEKSWSTIDQKVLSEYFIKYRKWKESDSVLPRIAVWNA